jgi:biotin operon repressor
MGQHVFDVKKMRGLDRSERAVLLELAEIANEDNVAWPSNEHLSARLVCSERTIQKALKQLEELGLIIRKNRFSVLPDGFVTARGRIIEILPENWKKFMMPIDSDDRVIDLSKDEIETIGTSRKAIQIYLNGRT